MFDELARATGVTTVDLRRVTKHRRAEKWGAPVAGFDVAPRAEQSALFSERELCPWLDEWEGMPEFICEDFAPRYQLLVSFTCAADLEDFGALVEQPIKLREGGRQLRSIWYPARERRTMNHRYRDPA